ncbi:unnamed protein product [Closterium sp. Yama58-4]|nr:unnamed protein product [Closterium sp. Yama58-4]
MSGHGQRLSAGTDASAPRSVHCRAAGGGEKMAAQSRRVQVDATRVLAELLQAKDLEATVRERVEDLSEEFFMVASAYVDMARKEGNPEVVQQLESVLKVAMAEKEKTLRPEIRMLNQLLRDKTPADRAKTLAAYEEYLVAGSYFFHLLNRMLVDVESQKPPQTKLLSQLRTINREVKEAAKGGKKSRKESISNKSFISSLPSSVNADQQGCASQNWSPNGVQRYRSDDSCPRLRAKPHGCRTEAEERSQNQTPTTSTSPRVRFASPRFPDSVPSTPAIAVLEFHLLRAERSASCGSTGGNAARGLAGGGSRSRVVCAAAANSTSTPHMEVPVSMHETRRLPPVLSLPDAIIALSAALSNLAASPPCFPSGVIRFEPPLSDSPSPPPGLSPRIYFSPRAPRGTRSLSAQAPSEPAPDGASWSGIDGSGIGSVAGVGAAVMLKGEGEGFKARHWRQIRRYLSDSSPSVRFFGGIRFDAEAPTAHEWAPFGTFLFLIPLVRLPDCLMPALGVEWRRVILSQEFWHVSVQLHPSTPRTYSQTVCFFQLPSHTQFSSPTNPLHSLPSHACSPFNPPSAVQPSPHPLLVPHPTPQVELRESGTVLEAVAAARQALSLVRPVFSTPHPPRISTQVTSKAVAPDELLWHLAVERTLQSLGHRDTQGGDRDGRAGGAGDAEGALGGEMEGRGEGGAGAQSQQSWGDKPWMLEPSRIDQMPLSKVVMARRTALTTVDPVDPVVLLGALQARDPSAFQFLLEPHAGCAFVSSTPERLFARKGLAVTSEAVAATRARAQAPAEDHSIALGLLLSNKDHEEFEIVRESVHRHLAGVCESVCVEEYKRIISQHRVQHLYARINGRLFSTAGEFNLLTSLHPTPAVAGHPQKQSQESIRFAESFDRGLYAGPVGWFSADASEFAVGIRSALVQSGASMAPWEGQPGSMDAERVEDQGEGQRESGRRGGGRVLLYAGVGVVKGTKAASEWSELNLKTRQFEALLGGAPVPVPGRGSSGEVGAAGVGGRVDGRGGEGAGAGAAAGGAAGGGAVAGGQVDLEGQPNINFVWCRMAVEECVRLGITVDERSLAFHALGYAMAARRPAAIITSSGTAVSNLLPAVVEASQQHVPLLVLTADRPAELRDTAANQTIDQVGKELSLALNFPSQVPDEAWVARTVAASLPDGHALFLGNSMPIRDIDMYAAAPSSISFSSHQHSHLASAAGGAGENAAGADGAASAERSGQPPVTVVVVNNGGGGIFSLLPVAGTLDSHVFSELFSTPHQVQLHHLCKAHRVAYFRATTRTSLLSSLQAAWATHRHAVVEVHAPPIHLNVLSHRLLQAAARTTAARALSLFQRQMERSTGLEGERGEAGEGVGRRSGSLFVAETSIERIRVVLREPPTSVAVSGAALSQSEREGLLLHVRLEGGGLGTGEVSPLPGLHLESLLDAHEQLCLLSHRLPGLALPLSLPLLNGSFSLWVWHTLGIQPASLYSSPTHRVRVRCCGLLDGSRGTIPSVARAAAHLVHSLGFTALKIKVARRASPAEDAAMVLAVREAVGPRVHIRVDANRSWSLSQAVEFGRLVAPCNVAFIEEPVSNLHLLPEFYQATGLPFALDESLDDALLLPPSHDTPTLALPSSLDWSGLAAVVVKPSRLGGMEAAAVVARWATLLGAECVVSSSFESRQGLASLCHFAAFLDTHPFPSPQPQAQDAGALSSPESPPGSPTAVAHGLEGVDRFSHSPPLLVDERSSDGQLGVLLSARSDVGGASGMLTRGVLATSDAAAVAGPEGGRAVGAEGESAAASAEDATIGIQAKSLTNLAAAIAPAAAVQAASVGAARTATWEERRETVALSNGGTVEFNILVTPSPHSSSTYPPLSPSGPSLPPATPPPTLVFLHGFLGSHVDWLPLANSLSLSFPCALIDLPGHGSTTVALPAHPTTALHPSPPALSFEEAASALASLLARLLETPAAQQQQQQQQGKVVLVGYSMGARLALYLALRYPHLVSAAVVISGSPGIREAAARASRAESDDSLAAVLTAGGLEQYVHSWYQQPLWASLRAHPCFQPMLARRFASSPSASPASPPTDGASPPMVVFPGGTEAGLAMALRGLSTGRQPVAAFKSAILGGQAWEEEEEQYEGDVVGEGDDFEEEIGLNGSAGGSGGGGSGNQRSSRFDGAWAADMKRVHLEESLGATPGMPSPEPSTKDKASMLPIAAAKAVLETGGAVNVAKVEGAGHAIHEERPEALLPLIRLFASNGSQASAE